MSGFVGDLSPKQEEALKKLQTAVRDVEGTMPERSDHYYLRWLRARKFDVSKAEDMLRKHLELRQKYKLDTILTDYKPIEVLEKYFPGGLMGEDRDGHPVWYDNFNIDFRGLHYSVRLDDILQQVLYRAEYCAKHCRELSSQKGKNIMSLTIVVDYEKLSIQRHYYWPGINMMRKILALLEANYPELTKCALLINLPSIFPVCFSLVKHILAESTRKKINFLRSNYREELQKYISPDQLPAAYGGTRCEPDPYCTKYIIPGGDIPEEYYLANLMETCREEMERVVVGRGSSRLLTYRVDTPGTVLRWEFLSTDHDIGYGWFLKTSEKQEEVELVPVKRKESHIIPESGVHVCKCPGDYVLKFDNTYSWTRSKEVLYSVKMLPPESDGTTPTDTEATPTPSVEQSSDIDNSSAAGQVVS